MDFFAFASQNARLEWRTGFVVAKRLIAQSPLSDAPDVPRGTCGHIDDEADGYAYVDFGEPYGVVICDASEVVDR